MNAQFLRLKEGPFLLTLLFGIASWLTIHAVDRLQQSAVIEYRLCEIFTNGVTRVECDVDNLYADKCFENLKFSLGGPAPKDRFQYFTNGSSLVYSPAHLPTKEETYKEKVTIQFPEFHPRWRFKLSAEKHGDFDCYLQFKTDRPSSVSSDIQGIRLMKYGWHTFLLRHEIEILGALLGLTIFSIVGYLIWLNKAVSGGTPSSGKNK